MSTIEVKVPDIGDFKDVPVIEVLVKPGDAVKAEDSLVTLESDKATMDVPSPAAGAVEEVKVKVGDKVGRGRGDPARSTAAAAAPAAASAARCRGSARARRCAGTAAARRRAPLRPGRGGAGSRPPPRRRRRSTPTAFKGAHASPSVRRFARELGVDLARGQGHRRRRAASPRKTCRRSSSRR